MSELRCSDCNRYMGEAHGTVVASLKCPNSSCKKINQVKKVVTGPHDLKYKFEVKNG